MKYARSKPGSVTLRDKGWGVMNIPPPAPAEGSIERIKLGIVKEPLLVFSVQTKPTRPVVFEFPKPPIITEPGFVPPDQVTVRGWLRSMLEREALFVQRMFPPTFNVA